MKCELSKPEQLGNKLLEQRASSLDESNHG